MKDLDFDELDKAVNSLMGGVSAKVKEEDPLKTLTISTTLADDEKPAYERIDKAAERIGNETIEVPSAKPERVLVVPATRRAGRFMDVMHPSSDMKISASAPEAPALPLAQPTFQTVPTRTTPVVQAPAVAPIEAVNTTPVIDDIQPSASPSVTPIDAPVPTEPIVESVLPPEVAPVTPLPVESAVEPQVSPFLADAKVEKRPLGSQQEPTSTSAAAPQPYVPEADLPDPIVEPDFQLEPTDDVVLREEYHDELLAIEMKGTDDVSPSTETAAVAPVDKPAAPSGPASIPQQYKVEENSGDQTSGSIYDVNDYHKPLSHPAKKSSGWLWVLLTIIIIVACGGGAAAFFLLTK